MLQEKIYPYSKEFKTECEQIEFWDNSLGEIQNQLSIFYEIIKTQNDHFEAKASFLSELSRNYYKRCQKLSSEPSNIFYLTQLVIEMISKSTKTLNDKMKTLNFKLSVTIPEIIQNIRLVRENVIEITSKTMCELTELIATTKNYQKMYMKIKANLDEAQLKKKKLEDKEKYAYNVTVKEKAEKKVLENVKEMEMLLPKLKEYSKEVEEKKEKFNLMMKENFEIVMVNAFKNLANLHQCFFLLSKTNYDINTECVLIHQNAFKQFTNLSININDYTERKFAELQGIKFDSLEMINISDEILQTNPSQLDNVCESVLNYIMIFCTCLKIRKNLMKEFLKTFDQIMLYEEESREVFKKKEKKFSDSLSNFSMIGEGTLKSWKNIFNSFHIIELLTKKNAISDEILNNINETRSELKLFTDKWKKIEKNIIEKRNELNAINNELIKKQKNKPTEENKNIEKIKKVSVKLIALIKESFDFIKNQVSSIRDKDTKRINKVLELFSKSAKIFENVSQKIVDFSQKEIENSTNLDIFEECHIIFTKYFTKFNITNYENFLEKIKVKILLKTDFQKEKLGQSTYEQLNDFSTNTNNISKDNNEINTNNELHFDSSSSVSSILKQPIEIENEVNENNENDQNNIVKQQTEKTFSSPKDILSSEDDKINFINNDIFNHITNNANPYQNFKEPEIKRYKTKIENKSDSHSLDKKTLYMETDETLVDSFSCAYKEKILLQGKLFITTKKIVFDSLFNSSTIFGKGGTKLVIPLEDIESVNKKSNLKIFKNSIEIKTIKTSLFFTSFLFRDKCYEILLAQINEIKQKMQCKQGAEAPSPEIAAPKKYLKVKSSKAKKIKKMLDDIHFFEKIDEIHNERMNRFTSTYQNREYFLPIESFKQTHIDETMTTCPLCVIFNYIFNQNTVIDEFQHDKGFYESIYMDRNDMNIVVDIDEEFFKSPQFFNDIDYVINLFTNYDKNELSSLLSSINEWPDVFKYRIQLTHPIKKYFIGPDRVNLDDRFVVYFISPKCFIVDDCSYGVGFPFSDTFVSITQYKFDSEIRFDLNKGKFVFETRCSIRFLVKFIKRCLFEGKVAEAGYEAASTDIKFFIYERMKTVIDNQGEMFNEMYDKMNDDSIQRLIRVNENFGYDEEEEEDNEEEENNDDNENKGIESQEQKQEENEVKEEKKEEEAPKEETKIEESFIKKNKKYILISMIMLMICNILRQYITIDVSKVIELVNVIRSKADYNTIFNVIMLSIMVYIITRVK